MGLGKTLMKVVVRVRDVVTLVQKFEASPKEAMREFVAHVQEGAEEALEKLLRTEIGLFLGRDAEGGNKRNGFRTRGFGIKGIGLLRVRVPRDREGRFESRIVPPGRRYNEAAEKDLALLHLAGLSTRTLSYLSKGLLGIQVSHQEVTNALHTIVPAAKEFLDRPIGGRNFKYLFLDGTNFRIRRTTVEKEPTLVVLGVDTNDRKSILAMVQGDKEDRRAWEMVLGRLKERGLPASMVQLGIMDGLPGLEEAFGEAFPNARTARCWVHKARNVFPLVPRRYQAAFKGSWDQVAYADGLLEARTAFHALKSQWGGHCGDAVKRLEKDLEALLVHYEFPKNHWDALRTTNPIERVNKEFKRRSKAMETIGPDGLKTLLAFTALRLEFGWAMTPITSRKLLTLNNQRSREGNLADVEGLIH